MVILLLGMKIKDIAYKLGVYENKEENILIMKKRFPDKLPFEAYKENLLQDFLKVLLSPVN